MSRIVKPLIAFALLLAGCTQEQPNVTLRSLESTGELSFVCVTQNGDGTFKPHSIDDCPDDTPEDPTKLPTPDDYKKVYRILTLATQATRGEIAVIDSYGKSKQVEVIDTAPTVPGFNFLPVGGQPADIVSTPDGVASFVGVGEVGKEGIFALPTKCVGPPATDKSGKALQPPRELTTWPACRLPSAPGDMAILIDPEDRTSCDPNAPPPVTDAATATGDCANVTLPKTGPPGRRMLAVSLPDRAEIWVLDAQGIVDREPGSYEPCVPERRILLKAEVPDTPVTQIPPPDLDVPGCVLGGLNHGPPVEKFQPQPAGFAVLEQAAHRAERLFIADRAAPVIHVLDVTDPCNLRELTPLLPESFVDPTRIVTTKKLAVSPPTTDGSRYLYAIDERNNGSVMIFDVSDEATTRTPLIRPRSAEFPFEPPDRIAFDAPVQDVTFVRRDRSAPDPATGEVPVGVLCDPDVSGDPTATAHQPSGDFSSGARPNALRGVFGMLALDTGQIAVIDVEDFDAPCRRPIFPNTSPIEDFRGCANDPSKMERLFYTRDPQDETTKPTVTNEVSCKIVEPHRARSFTFFKNQTELGVHAPSLRSFPRLVSDVGRTLPTDDSEDGRKNPKMLGVDFAQDQRAQVYVGPTLYQRAPEGETVENKLVVDPGAAQNSSLVLNFKEPRAYAPSEVFTAEYEGTVITERRGARFEYTGGANAKIVDSDVLYCDRGVQDERLAARMGQDVGATDLATFEKNYGDFAIITSDLLDSDDDYWQPPKAGKPAGAGASCGDANPKNKGAGFLACLSQFGTHDDPTPLRDLRIIQASNTEIIVEPRLSSDRDRKLDLLGCCFPAPIAYEVHAAKQWIVQGSLSGFRHNIHFNRDTNRCERDCNPLRAEFQSRALEVSCDPDSCPIAADGKPVIGVAKGDDVACVVDETATRDECPADNPLCAGLVPINPCIFKNLTTSFAIYRGREASQKGMSFSWEVIGGFTPFMIDLRQTDTGPGTTPQSIVYSPQLDRLVLADGATKGVVFVDLNSTFGIRSVF